MWKSRHSPAQELFTEAQRRIKREQGLCIWKVNGWDRRKIERERERLPPFRGLIPIFSQSHVALQGVGGVTNPTTMVDVKDADPFLHSSPSWNLNMDYANRVRSLKRTFSTLSRASVWLEGQSMVLCCPTQSIHWANFLLTRTGGEYILMCFRKVVL